MIDPTHVRTFWERRAERITDLPFESVGNLEQDAGNLRLKVDHETERVLDCLARAGIGAHSRVLDLGAGVGQWAFRLAPRVGEVVAVERSTGFAEIMERERAARGVANVHVVHAAAEEYVPPAGAPAFDLVFISGLFVYLVDEQAEALVRNLRTLVRPGGHVLVRDGTSILGRRHEIDRRYSEHLDTLYSATYRTRDEYLALAARAGLAPVDDAAMFPEGHPLNKYPETRLWLYLFRAGG